MTDRQDIDQPPESGDPPTEEAPTREQAPADEGAASEPRRLLRSRGDRVIAGVSGGLGRYFDVDPVIIRIAFAVSILFGGLGVIAYIAAILFVPSDDGTGSPAPPQRGRTLVRAVGVIALAFVALFGFGALVTGAAFVTGIGYGVVVAVVIVLIGVALVATAFRGGARWLVVPALALSIGVGVAAAADLDLEGGIGEREYRPLSASAIPDDGYDLGVGSLAVDLRSVDWSSGRVVDLDARVGVGEMIVAVPTDVCVVADARAGVGELDVAGELADGVDVELATAEGARATPRLRLDAEVDMGRVVVVNDDDVDLGDYRDRERGPGPFDELDLRSVDAGSRGANEAACEAPPVSAG